MWVYNSVMSTEFTQLVLEISSVMLISSYMWCISVFIELKYFILIVTLTEPPAQRRVLYAVVIFMCLSEMRKPGVPDVAAATHGPWHVPTTINIEIL